MSTRPRNAFLRSLSDVSFQLLEQHLTSVEMHHARVLSEPDQRIEWVYFPETCLLSILTRSESGDSVETTMVGSEGALGLLEVCGLGRSSATNLVQIEGRAQRAPAQACRALVRTNENVGDRAFSLFDLQATEIRQSGMCQALHPVEARLARWLLESSDRAAGRNPMPLTQEFLAAMLGVQRTTVTNFALQLQKTGLIGYTRGSVSILDKEALEHRACECRKVSVEQRQRHGLEPMADFKAHLSVVSS